MKAISHPSPELQQYNKVLQFISFPICLGFAVENLWITALMIAYQTPAILDSFIWILPTIISILVRPVLITYVHKVFSPRQAELALVSHFVFAGAVGCCLIAASSQYFEDHWRILTCSIGWTVMDVSLQFAQYFSDKTKQRLEKLGYEQSQQFSSYSNLAGNVLGYSVSLVVCLWKGGKTMKKFYLCSSYTYWFAGIIAAAYWAVLYFSSRDRLVLQSRIHQPQSIIRKRGLAEYLPGYYELTRSAGFDRWLLGLHFTFLFIVDTLLIYGPMWIIWNYELQGEKQGSAYNLGMREGCLLLLIFAVFSHFDFLGIAFKHFNLLQKLKYFKYLLIIISIFSMLLFTKTGHEFVYSLAGLIGLADGLYNNSIEPEITENYPVFDSSKELVNRLEKLFILCPMPFLVMIVFQRDDIQDCLTLLPLLVLSLLILSKFWIDKTEIDATGNLQKIEKQL